VRVELPCGPEAAALYSEAEKSGQDPVATLAAALEAGAGAMRRVTDRGTGEAVERALSNVPAIVREAVRRGVLEASEATPQHAVELQKWLGGWMQGLHAAQTDTVAKVGELAEGLRSQKELDALTQSTTAKGRPFERALLTAMEAFGALHGDQVHDVSNSPGLGGSKVGDLLLVLADAPPPERRVAVEAKAGEVSLPKSLGFLDEAQAVREAQASVIVFAKLKDAPTRGLPMRYYGGGRFACVYDQEEGSLVLDATLGLARAYALASGAPGVDVDTEKVADAVRRLTEAVEDGRAVARGLAAARRGVDQADEAYTRMRDRVLAVIGDLS
jgi:hypothetical protein